MLVTPDKRLKVADFGIARALESIRVDEKTDLVWGSPQYFSPEQAAGLAPLPASDVYSLGVILYEMLTGQLPFQSSQPEELARMHREDLPPLPSKLNPLIPHELERILLKVLTKAPSARYRSADQFGRILSNFALNTDAIPVQSSAIPEKAPSINLEHTQAPVITNLKEMQPISVISNQPVSTVDWATWGLGLLAFLLAGGLIPFWMYVILKLNSIR